jgi:hypothetical protein
MGRVWGKDAVQKNRFTTTLSVITALDESPIRDGLLVVGTDDGLLQISNNGGVHWKKNEKFPGIPKGAYVSDVCASGHDTQRLYVSFNDHKRGDFRPYLLRSNDGGKTWTSIAANLPKRHAVWCVIEDHINSNLLFVGTELGLFFTVNGGEHWFAVNNGTPPIAFRDLAIQRREHDLVAATFGRGFFVLDDISALQHLNSTALAGKGGLFPPRDTWVYEERGNVEAVFGNYATSNPPVGSTLSYFLRDGLPKGDGNRIMLSIKSADGAAVRSLPGPTAAGAHRVRWDLRHAPKGEGRKQPQRRQPSRRRGGNRRRGTLVEPGEYTIRLLQITDGKQRVLGQARTIKVQALPETSSRSRK